MAFRSCGEAWTGAGKTLAWLRPADGFGQASVFTAADVSCVVIPDGCVGLATLAALEQGIPVIAVRENKNRMKNDLRMLPFGAGKGKNPR